MNPFGTTRTGNALYGEHQSTLQTLNDIDALIRGRRPTLDKPDTQARLASLAQVLEDDVTSHFQFEEDHLFPILENAGAAGMVAMLLGEHSVIRPLAEEVRRLALDALAAGAFTDASWSQFRQAGAELVEREVFHVQKENMGLLAALAQVLDTEQDSALAEIHAAR